MTAADSDAFAKMKELAQEVRAIANGFQPDATAFSDAAIESYTGKVQRLFIVASALEALQAVDSQPMRSPLRADPMTSNQANEAEADTLKALKEKVEVDMRTAWEAINELKGFDSLAAFNTKTFAEGRLSEAKELLGIIREAQKEKTP